MLTLQRKVSGHIISSVISLIPIVGVIPDSIAMESPSSTLIVLTLIVTIMGFSMADNILIAHSLGFGSHITTPLKMAK